MSQSNNANMSVRTISRSTTDSKVSSSDYLEIHQIEVVDFALQADLQRKGSVSKTAKALFGSSKAKYTRRGKFSKWIESV